MLAFVFSMTPGQGAYTSLFAATSPLVHKEKRKYAGGYLIPYGELQEPSEETNDPVAARDLWESSDRIVKELQA